MQFHFFCSFNLLKQFLFAALQLQNILNFSLFLYESILDLFPALFFEFSQSALPKLVDIFFGLYLDQSHSISLLSFRGGLALVLLSYQSFIDFSLALDLLEESMIGLSELRAFCFEIVGAVDTGVPEEAAVAAGGLVGRVPVFLDLNGGGGTSCFNLKRSMRTSILLRWRSSLRYMDLTFACRYISRMSKRF